MLKARISSSMVFLAGFLACLTANGQSGVAPPARNEMLQIELTKTIRANKAKIGDAVKARTVTALILPNQTVVPEGSKLLGHVCAANSERRGANGVAIGIAFDEVQPRKGEKLRLNFSIRAGAMPQQILRGASTEEDGDSMAAPMKDPDPGTPSSRAPRLAVGFGGVSRTSSSPPSPSPQEQVGGKSRDEVRADLRALPAGTLTGMPGATMTIDGPAGGATFRSSNGKLELKSGLQLMLRVNP